jgi:hypothetical protein
MIRLDNYTEELGRLSKTGLYEEIYAEFTSVCLKVLGVYLHELFDEDCKRLGEMVPNPAQAIRLCRAYGFDLSTNDGTPAVPGWHAFAILILAKAEGLIPTIPTLRRERRLAIHAEQLIRVQHTSP